jgi:hypothetical protein
VAAAPLSLQAKLDFLGSAHGGTEADRLAVYRSHIRPRLGADSQKYWDACGDLAFGVNRVGESRVQSSPRWRGRGCTRTVERGVKHHGCAWLSLDLLSVPRR